MKKHLRLLPLVLIPIVLASCEHPTKSTSSEASQSTSISSVEPSSNIVSSSASNSASISSSSSSASSSEKPVEVEIGKKHLSNSWDEVIEQMVKMTVGDLWEKVPSFIAPSYEAIVDNATDGDDKFLVFEVKCFNPNATSATRLYKEKMVELGYTIAPTNDYGYLMKDYYSDLFVSFGVVDDEIDYFEIAAVIRTTRESKWNSAAINMYADMEVPEFPATAYQTTYDNSKDQMTVFALFVTSNAITQYETILQNAGYTFDSKSTIDMPIYIDPTGYVTVQLYQTYGDYNTDALYIIINNNWPTTGIAAFTGLTHFPKLESNNAVFDGYVYMDLGGQGRDEDYVLCIYYKYASTTDFSNYVTLLINNTELGFTAGEPQTSPNGVVSVQLTGFWDLYNIPVTVALNPNTNEICIAIYQRESL